MKKFLLIFFALAFFSYSAKTQEIALSNNVMDVMNLNPALVGSKQILRITANNQLRWVSAIHKTVYNSVSADLGLNKFGFGINSEYNILSDGFKNTNLSIAGSYRFGKLRKFTFTPGIKIASRAYFLNTEDLVFYDQLSVYDGVLSTNSSAEIAGDKIFLTDLSLGFVSQFPIETHRTHPAWVNIGFAYDHLPKTTFSFNSDPNIFYPAKYTFHTGVYIPLYSKNAITKVREYQGFMMYPNAKYVQQGEFSIINIGTLMYKKRFVFGIAAQSFKSANLYNKNQFIATVGFEFNIGDFWAMQAMYNFDMGVSMGNLPMFMTHEFSIAVFYINKRKTDCSEGLEYKKKRWFNSNEVQTRHKGECPPGSTPIRKNSDVIPFFYPIELPKAYIGLQN